MKKQYLRLFIPFSLVYGVLVNAQEIHTNVFIRTPHIVNYNAGSNALTYSPLVSIGAGLSHKKKFMELATFMGDDDTYGFYTFFGTVLHKKDLGQKIGLNTNWFGEITYVPPQNMVSEQVIYTSGVCVFPNWSHPWGAIGIPICLGLGYAENEISLNTRFIVNLSINLN